MRSSIDPRALAEMATIRVCLLPDLQDLAAVIGQLRAGATSGTAVPHATDVKKKAPLRGAESNSCSPKAPSFGQAEGDHMAPRLSDPLVGRASTTTPEEAQWNDTAAQRCWEQMRTSIDGMLAGYLARAERITAADSNRVIAWFAAKYSFFKESCEQPDHRRRIEDGLTRIAGRRVTADFDLVPDSEPDVGPRKSRRELLREVSERPFVRQAVELFGDESTDLRYVPPQRDS
jgi:hypothetical protein